MNRNLLLVEDDAQMREELAHIFRANHIHAFSAGSGAEGVAMAEMESFDAALLDIRLPDCSGVDLARRLRGKQPNCACILMTAYASIDGAIHALRNGVQDYILKPFSPEEIVTAVRRGFDSRENLLKRQNQVDDLQLQKRILEEKIQELRRLNEVFIGREGRILVLKREVNELCRRLGEPIKYQGF